jgi:hypothetical protein
MRPRKYDSSSATGSVAGMRFSVEEAGSREPCFERRSRAGGQLGVCGAGGVRYRARRVWYIEGISSSGSEVEAFCDWAIVDSVVDWRWT